MIQKRVVAALALGFFLSTTGLPSFAADKPVPDSATLLQQLEDHQKTLDKIRENYTYRERVQTDTVDGSGKVKKTEVVENEVFFVNGHSLKRMIQKNGVELDAGEKKKEQDRVNKEVEKAVKTPSDQPLEGKRLTISMVLPLVKLSQPRRETYNGHPVLVVDFVGDPKAKAHGREQEATKKMAGTLWINEEDLEVVRLAVRFDEDFKIGGGLLASIQKGSNFQFDQEKVHSELWLPTAATAKVDAKIMMLKGIHQNVYIKMSDYRKFHADAFVVPGSLALPKKN